MKTKEKSKNIVTPQQQRTLLVEKLTKMQHSADTAKTPIVRAISKAVSKRLEHKIIEIDELPDQQFFSAVSGDKVDSDKALGIPEPMVAEDDHNQPQPS
jgi:hypothetical protein